MLSKLYQLVLKWVSSSYGTNLWSANFNAKTVVNDLTSC